MIKITSLPTIAGALLACVLSAAPAQAGPNRTWVSGMGTDSGACTRAIRYSRTTTGIFSVDGATTFSYGDNDIDGNANNNTGALTPLAMH